MKKIIESAWDNKKLLDNEETKLAVKSVIESLDKGEIRVAEPTNNGWVVNEWIKKAVILYFPIQKMKTVEIGPFEFHDKIPLKNNYAKKGVAQAPRDRPSRHPGTHVCVLNTKIIELGNYSAIEL